jgi:acyl carrier protein
MRERIKKVLSEVLKTTVDDDTAQDSCAAWDSLHHLNLIIELEIEFDISFEPEEIACMKSIEIIEKIISVKL